MGIIFSLAVLVILATVFSYINERFIKLPTTIGIMVITIVFSLFLVITQRINPGPLQQIGLIIRSIDFTNLLMGGMLYFLLFAGAIQIDFEELRKEKYSIIILSTLSVVISAFFVGSILYGLTNYIFPLFGLSLKIPFIFCLLFGSLISPTDPVAVLSILKTSNVSKTLENKITGEALFNDGIAVILFSVVASIALGKESINDISVIEISWLLFKEVVGAFIAGIALGAVGVYAIRTTTNSKLPILITLSIVIVGYMIATSMDISGPLTMVSAGLIIAYRAQPRRNRSAPRHTGTVMAEVSAAGTQEKHTKHTSVTKENEPGIVSKIRNAAKTVLLAKRKNRYEYEHGEEFKSCSDTDLGFLKIFWELIDEVMNAILFLLIGFEILVMPDLRSYWVIGVITIFVVLLGRYVSVRLPISIIPFKEKFTRKSIFILVWGGLRGGVSIALALSITGTPYRDVIVAITYYVVIFSIVVQGLSIEKLSRRIKD